MELLDFKRANRGQTLADGIKIEGKGRLTNERVKKMQEMYGNVNAIRGNKGKVEKK